MENEREHHTGCLVLGKSAIENNLVLIALKVICKTLSIQILSSRLHRKPGMIMMMHLQQIFLVKRKKKKKKTLKSPIVLLPLKTVYRCLFVTCIKKRNEVGSVICL